MEFSLPRNEIQLRLYSYRSMVRQLGDHIDRFLSTTTPRRKYITELLVRVPLMFAIHQWYLLSPYSEYRIIELFLGSFRQFGALILFGCWALDSGQLLILYISLFIDVTIAWLVQVCYWMFQNEADEFCQKDGWMCWGDIDDPWWIPSILALLIQIIYLLYLDKKYSFSQELGEGIKLLGLAVLLPHITCSLGILIYISAPLYYYISKGMFCLVLIGQFLEQFTNDPKVNITVEKDARGNRKLPPLPGPWFTRDLHALFGIVFLTIAICIDCMVSSDVRQMAFVTYSTSILGDWCTNFFVVMSFSSIFALLSNAFVAVSQYFVIGYTDFRAAFNANTGSRVAIGMSTFCIEAGIITVDRDLRIENMKSVIFLTCYIIISQAWDLTEQHFLFVINSGEIRKWYAYLRIILFSIFIVSFPSIITFYAASWLDIDLWLLLNASGNFNLIVRAFLSLIEIGLVSADWYIDDRYKWLEDAIYYARVLKSFGTLVCVVLICYYRFMAPFFDGWWVFRAFIIIADAIVICKMILQKEWKNFQLRRSLVGKLGQLPDASQEELADVDDVCSICYAGMSSGRKLPCKHIFHETCLRKWFQIKTVCPLCNSGVY